MKAVVISTKLYKPYKFGTCALCIEIYYSTICIKETMLLNKKIINRNRNSRRLGFIAVVRFSSPPSPSADTTVMAIPLSLSWLSSLCEAGKGSVSISEQQRQQKSMDFFLFVVPYFLVE
jgi:hypothetical protein